MPTHTTLMYGVFFIMPYIYALMIGVAWNVDRRFENFRLNTPDVPKSFFRYLLRWGHITFLHHQVIITYFVTTSCWYHTNVYLFRHSWFVILLLLQALHCLEFYLAYGMMAFFSIPGVFRLVFCVYMYIQATSIKIEEVPRDIFRVWSAKSEKCCS